MFPEINFKSFVYKYADLKHYCIVIGSHEELTV